MKVQGISGQYLLFLGAVLLVVAGGACAQNMVPLTGKLLQEPGVTTKTPSATPATTVSASTAAPPAATTTQAVAPVQQTETPASNGWETRIHVGDVTHILLQAQVDGRVAGPRLPMLGATADASWQRYLDSFKHPLPEYFENKVSKNGSN